jgi:hypothetical protein
MANEISTLHSHSQLENFLKFPKHIVLVDAKFAKLFHAQGICTTNFRHGGMEYVKVPILAFVRLGGVFKNFSA